MWRKQTNDTLTIGFNSGFNGQIGCVVVVERDCIKAVGLVYDKVEHFAATVEGCLGAFADK